MNGGKIKHPGRDDARRAVRNATSRVRNSHSYTQSVDASGATSGLNACGRSLAPIPINAKASATARPIGVAAEAFAKAEGINP
jgi:hypothetical protein